MQTFAGICCLLALAVSFISIGRFKPPEVARDGWALASIFAITFAITTGEGMAAGMLLGWWSL